jgi:hypothetical protein
MRSISWFAARRFLASFATLAALSASYAVQPPELPGTYRNPGPAIADDVFLQEICTVIATPQAVECVGTIGCNTFAGTADGLFTIQDDKLSAVPGIREPIHRIVKAGSSLFAFGKQHAFSFRADSAKVAAELDGKFADAALFNNQTILSEGNRLFAAQGTNLVPFATNKAPFAIEHLASFNDSLFLQGGGRIAFFDGEAFGGTDVYGSPVDLAWDWGALPSLKIRDILPAGPCLYIATDRGLGVLRGMTLSAIHGQDGLPFEDTTCLARGFTNDLWIGTSRGAIRKLGTEYHYFAGQRWLPNDKVNAIAVDGTRVFIATDGGISIISYQSFTLEAKAAYYEKHLRDWGQKRLGLVHKLEWDDALGQYVREAGDNDGGYSSDYLSAQSYRYAVTRDPAALAEALNTFHALVWLERMTGIPGFPARSVWVKGETGHKSSHGSGGYPAEWHDVPGTPFEWKGDTSSDELCAHFYATSLFLELAAPSAGAQEVALAKQHLNRIASHLLEHHWQLIDVDGKPTRWGRWDSDYFLTDEGHFDRGLQALEILSFMKTAGAVTGDANFDSAYDRLVSLGYPAWTLRQRVVFPSDVVANFEDQLSFWVYWNLLRLEKDPVLKSVYRRSFERTWEILRIEQQPWFNFVYGALTGNDCEANQAVRHLREWPLDLTIWSYQNSHRADLRTAAGYTAIKSAPRPFSPREREPMRWDGWTMQADGGTGGRDVVEPSGWLLAYWMGRYHGFIAPPAAHLQPDVKEQIRRGTRTGAAPYNGPARPSIE